MTSETQVEEAHVPTEEERAKYFAMLDAEKGYRMDRARMLTAEYAQNEEQVIVDLLCLAVEKNASPGDQIKLSLMYFHDETRESNSQDQLGFAGKEQADLAIESFFDWGPTAHCERRAMRAKKANSNKGIIDQLKHNDYHSVIGDCIADMLHFFAYQGKSPAKLLCQAIEIFVSNVYQQSLSIAAFKNLQAAIHAYVDDAALIVEMDRPPLQKLYTLKDGMLIVAE
jgi:hypothetical protein